MFVQWLSPSHELICSCNLQVWLQRLGLWWRAEPDPHLWRRGCCSSTTSRQVRRRRQIHKRGRGRVGQCEFAHVFARRDYELFCVCSCLKKQHILCFKVNWCGSMWLQNINIHTILYIYIYIGSTVHQKLCNNVPPIFPRLWRLRPCGSTVRCQSCRPRWESRNGSGGRRQIQRPVARQHEARGDDQGMTSAAPPEPVAALRVGFVYIYFVQLILLYKDRIFFNLFCKLN